MVSAERKVCLMPKLAMISSSSRFRATEIVRTTIRRASENAGKAEFGSGCD